MWSDAAELRDFYATALGQVARRLIRRRIRAVWPDVRGLCVLGLGYPTPYLGPFRGEAARVLAAMPAPQGVLHWPSEGRGLTTLIDEVELPFPDLSTDRVLVVHALECAESVRPMMRAIWRVLADGGRLMVVVPNRRGIWAHFERTPFGAGRPYSPAQLARVLREAMFTPIQTWTALHVPPVHSRMILSSAPALESIGQRLFAGFAGVILVEAAKQIYAAQPQAEPTRRRGYMPLAGRTPSAPTMR